MVLEVNKYMITRPNTASDHVGWLPAISFCSALLGWPIALLATCFHMGILLTSFFNPEDGGNMFLRTISGLSTGYMALYPRR
jgi:uncharacterized membrane protein